MKINFLKRFIPVCILLIAFLFYILKKDISIAEFSDHIKSYGYLAPLAYILAYTLLPLTLLPISIFNFASGIIFGPFYGAIYTVIGATFAAAFAFLLGRYIAYSWVKKNVRGILARIKLGVEKEGWIFVAFTRLIPILPYSLINYAFGLTEISFFTYITATLFSVIPGAFLYAYIGHVGYEVAIRDRDLIFKVLCSTLILFLGGLIAKNLQKFLMTNSKNE